MKFLISKIFHVPKGMVFQNWVTAAQRLYINLQLISDCTERVWPRKTSTTYSCPWPRFHFWFFFLILEKTHLLGVSKVHNFLPPNTHTHKYHEHMHAHIRGINTAYTKHVLYFPFLILVVRLK